MAKNKFFRETNEGLDDGTIIDEKQRNYFIIKCLQALATEKGNVAEYKRKNQKLANAISKKLSGPAIGKLKCLIRDMERNEETKQLFLNSPIIKNFIIPLTQDPDWDLYQQKPESLVDMKGATMFGKAMLLYIKSSSNCPVGVDLDAVLSTMVKFNAEGKPYFESANDEETKRQLAEAAQKQISLLREQEAFKEHFEKETDGPESAD